jgi:plastocyanin
MTKLRVLMFGAAAAVMLAWALPAMAHPAKSLGTVSVVAGKPTEFGYTLSTKTVPPGTVTFSLTDKGALPHDIKICSKAISAAMVKNLPNACAGTGSALADPQGPAVKVKFTFKTAGTYEYLCTLPGHAAGGMKGVIKVT